MKIIHRARFIVPDGWACEQIDPAGYYVLIKSPEGLMVTVDFIKRGFRSGFSQTGRMTSSGTYGGRGWKTALCGAAVRWLDSVRST